jgi:hypothetical protein
MPRSDGSPLDPIPEESFDGLKYTTELKKSDHKCKFIKISSNEIRCNCGKGYSGNNIDMLLKLFDKRN